MGAHEAADHQRGRVRGRGWAGRHVLRQGYAPQKAVKRATASINPNIRDGQASER